jgi:hypothetical protein
VQLLRYVYSYEGQRTLKIFGSSQTNDRGEYRLYGITPGRYYVRAGTSWMPSDYSYFDSVSPLFYPGVADTSQASIVAVESGGVLGGIDFNLNRQESHRIRGHIFDNDPNGSPASIKTLRCTSLAADFRRRRNGQDLVHSRGLPQMGFSNSATSFRDSLPLPASIVAKVRIAVTCRFKLVTAMLKTSDDIDGKHHKRTYPHVGRRRNF